MDELLASKAELDRQMQGVNPAKTEMDALMQDINAIAALIEETAESSNGSFGVDGDDDERRQACTFLRNVFGSCNARILPDRTFFFEELL